MSAIIMEYRYEHSEVDVMTGDYPEFDYVVVTVFDTEVKRIPVQSWEYAYEGERGICERAVIHWLQGNLDGG